MSNATKLDVLKARLSRTEGRRNKPYVDTVGKITIGVGHNLTDLGLKDEIIDKILELDIFDAINDAAKLPVYVKLNAARKTVLIDMVFNMGLAAVQEFRNTLQMLNIGDYEGAANNMLKSKWAEQVGNRAIELANIVRSGEVNNVTQVVE